MTEESWERTREAFGQTADWFVRTTAEVGDRWDDAALGEWSVRDLVGHTSRAFLTVEAYLGQPIGSVEVATPVDYFRLALASVGDRAAVAQRGRDAGAALGPDAAEAVRVIAGRVLALVAEARPDDPVATPVGGMRLLDYLATRTFELAVHTCDLAVALGRDVEVPAAAATESLVLLGGLAARSGQTASLLLAATGRRGLPDGFTVL